MFSLKDYSYELPPDRIAHQPAERRERSRLLCLDRETGGISHRVFRELHGLLSPPDVLVLNDTEVVPGRLFGKKATGGNAEVLILNYGHVRREENEGGDAVFECLLKASKRPRPGTKLFFDQGLEAEVLASREQIHTLRFSCPGNFEDVLYRIGKMPLPPYIRRTGEDAPCDDEKRYQTVYASQKGAIAAPTAGLHFSEELLGKIGSKGVSIAPITLHVGYGTFLPVRAEDIREHRMHSESYDIPRSSADAINKAKDSGGRVIAVGTTCVRTLEYASDDAGRVAEGGGHCDLFIYPGYRFKTVDAMVTNFHLPESTLLMLVSAFAGRENILNAYETAIREKYRFYSYGDAMFIG